MIRIMAFKQHFKVILYVVVILHRLSDNERPLVMCLGWTAEGLNNHQYVLQDNDTEEIMVGTHVAVYLGVHSIIYCTCVYFQWDAFSTPELENFLRILSREENEYLEQVRNKYQLLRIHMNQRIKELLLEKRSMRDVDPTRDGVFV